MAYRQIHDSSATSLSLSSCSLLAHLTFAHLTYVADCWGRGVASPRTIVGEMFKLRQDVTEKMVAGWLVEWEKAGLISTYQIGANRYFQIINFDRWQKDTVRSRTRHATPSRFPSDPDGIPDNVRTKIGRESDSARTESELRPNNVFRKSVEAKAKAKAQTKAKAEQAAGRQFGEQADFEPMDLLASEFQRAFQVECQRQTSWQQFTEYRKKLGDDSMIAILNECNHARIRDGSAGFGLFIDLCHKGFRGEPNGKTPHHSGYDPSIDYLPELPR